MSQSVRGISFNALALLNTLCWRVSHRLQAWHRLAAFCRAAQSISAKPSGKAFSVTAAGAGALGEEVTLGVAVAWATLATGRTTGGAGVSARSVGSGCTSGSTAALGCHTRTPMAANMARCRVSKDSVMPKPSPLQAHDHRVFALVGRHGIVVFSLALQVKTMGLVQSHAGTVTGPHLKPDGMNTSLA